MRDPSNSGTESQMWSFLIAVFAWMVESCKMTYFPPTILPVNISYLD